MDLLLAESQTLYGRLRLSGHFGRTILFCRKVAWLGGLAAI
jgi:hypothetical protein